MHTCGVRAFRTRYRKAVAGILILDVVGTIVATLLGYRFGRNTLVRCRRGHLFTTIWIPGASFKSLRLGWWRGQWCPVGEHWSIVVPVRETDLTPDEALAAHGIKDIRIP
jgi:hypothetical protein